MTSLHPPSQDFIQKLLNRKTPLPMQFVAAGMRNSELPNSASFEIALVGRSNVGKSSFINYLAGQKNLAKVSRTPGRTQTINLFSVEKGRFFFVDLPGYGFAESSRSTQEKWQEAMEEFFVDRIGLFSFVFLIDIRRDVNAEDRQLFQWLRSLDLAPLVIQTKADKVAKHELFAARKKHAEALGISMESIVATSAEKNMGRPEIYAGLSGLFDELRNAASGEQT